MPTASPPAVGSDDATRHPATETAPTRPIAVRVDFSFSGVPRIGSFMQACFSTLRAGVAAALVLALVACGGGGGGGAADTSGGGGPTDTTPTPATGGLGSGGSTAPGGVVSPGGQLQTEVPAPTYTGGSLGESAFEALNRIRRGAGAGLVAQDPALDTSAAAHARYLTTNLAAVGLVHIEDPSRPDYVATTAGDRMVKAGYVPGIWAESITSTGVSRQGADCIRNQLGTIYQAASLLSSVTDVGLGFGVDSLGYPACVIDLAAKATAPGGQVPATGALVAYPYDGQTNLVDTALVGFYSPRPPTSLFPGLIAGTPVLVNVRNADFVNLQIAGTLAATVTQFVMKDASGNLVPAGILTSPLVTGGPGVAVTPDTNLFEGYVALVPFSPLAKGATYQVTFAATLTTGGAALTKTWSFTTNP